MRNALVPALLMSLLSLHSCTKKTLDVSGGVVCMEDPSNVLITLSGEEEQAVTTDANGLYTLSDVDGTVEYELRAVKTLDNGASSTLFRTIIFEQHVGFYQELVLSDPPTLQVYLYTNNGQPSFDLSWNRLACSGQQFQLYSSSSPEVDRNENATFVTDSWDNTFSGVASSPKVYYRLYVDDWEQTYISNVISISAEDW